MSFVKLPTPAWFAAALALAMMGAALLRSPLLGAEAPVIIAPPAVDNPKAAGPPQTAVLAGGCFWGVQGVFEHVRGVQKVIAGYAGGDRASAQYETVSSGGTGHAESVKIVFDPAQVSRPGSGRLLERNSSSEAPGMPPCGPTPRWRSCADDNALRVVHSVMQRYDSWQSATCHRLVDIRPDPDFQESATLD